MDVFISYKREDRELLTPILTGYFITADLAIYLHPDYQGKGLGSYLIQQAIDAAPSLGIETLTATIFASNDASIQLFAKMGFERWGYMPRVARLEGVEKDLVLVGKRLAEPRGPAQG